MRVDDFLYGCHSGVQKAVRRGDLDLAMTCFNAMWRESKHRSWLKWRMTVLVEEDAWQMIGELAQFLLGVEDKTGKEEEREWRKFLYSLTVAPKSKDTEGLLYSAMHQEATGEEHPELEDMRFWHEMDSDPAKYVNDLFDSLVDGERKLSEYEIEALKLLRSRTFAGGMHGDRQACIANMLLLARRGLNEGKAKKSVAAGVRIWSRRFRRLKPRTVNLAWYVFDMHTYVGKMVSTVFMKHKAAQYEGIDKDKFEAIWFYLESAICYPSLVRYIPYTKGIVSAVDSMWWPHLLKIDLPFGGQSAKEVKMLWDTKMKAEVKTLVHWALEKRSR